MPIVFCSLMFLITSVEPALAETVRVPWPVWLVIQIWYLLVWIVSSIAWAATQLWNLTIAGLNAFWVFRVYCLCPIGKTDSGRRSDGWRRISPRDEYRAAQRRQGEGRD